jgi:hypothetical protein
MNLGNFNLGNIDFGQITQVLSSASFPITKAQLLQHARTFGANEQILGMLEMVPDKVFDSQQEILDNIKEKGLGGLGDLGNLGGFKF